MLCRALGRLRGRGRGLSPLAGAVVDLVGRGAAAGDRPTTSSAPDWWRSHASIAGEGSRSVDADEVAKFAALADTWWDTNGPYGALHRLNYARCPFIRVSASHHFGRASKGLRPFEGLSLLEVGCGGGILSESLAVLGFQVTAIDAAEESIEAAREHAKRNSLLSSGREASLRYEATTAETLQASLAEPFDVVVSSEVIEHVLDPPEFCKTLSSLVKPGGLVVISTLNRTLWSYGLAIVAAEDVLGLAPKGAHDWDQFVTPAELEIMCGDAGMEVAALSGMRWSIPKMQFELAKDTSVNYIAAFRKNDSKE